MINIPQKEGEDRKTYLVKLAIAYIEANYEYIGIENDILYYDDAECDGSCLANDLRAEFGIND